MSDFSPVSSPNDGAALAALLGYAQDTQQARQDKLTLSDLYRTAISPDGKLDRNALFTGAAQRGMGAQIPGMQKTFNEQDKAQREAEKAQIEQHLKKFELAGQIMNGVTDQPSWDRAREMAGQVLGSEAAAKMPQQYDPALIQENLAKAMTVKDQLEQKHKQLTFGETQRHNQATEDGAAAGREVTLRGQDKTDQRARDFNATKAEENQLKRDAKDETTNLTKSSQLASFDTMLGTLDRLGQHPGLARSVGAVGVFPTMPGSDSANFQAELNSFQSQAFIPMVAQLKGMGALSDAEGKKLTAAVGALDPKMGEQAFRDSVARITADMQAARSRMAGGAQPAAPGRTGATGSWGDGKAPAAPVSIKNAADYANLPSGAIFIAPDGQMRVKK